MTGRLWSPDGEGLAAAAAAIAAGAVVAFPTDTVFGLGCAAQDQDAIAAIYRIKGRPGSLPLILMAASWAEMDDYVSAPPSARRLGRRFWPGPLTLVLEAKPPGALLGGGATLGVRIPDHRIALELLRRTGPLATTSANRHGAPPAADAGAALAQLPELDGAVAEGGRVRIPGQPSSILDLTRDPPALIRQGALSARELGIRLASPELEDRRD